MSRRNINDDAKKFLGLPPFNTWSNPVVHDGYFASDCATVHGDVEFRKACEEAQKMHAIGMRAYETAIATGRRS